MKHFTQKLDLEKFRLCPVKKLPIQRKLSVLPPFYCLRKALHLCGSTPRAREAVPQPQRTRRL